MLEFRPGRNVDITIADGMVHKKSYHAWPHKDASRLADQLEGYAVALTDEPIPVAPTGDIQTVPGDVSAERHVVYTNRLCKGPNFSNLRGEAMQSATKQLVGQIASMTEVDSDGTLRTPIDVGANNFCIEDGRGVLVDLFPPLLRLSDRTFPLENIPFGFSLIRRNNFPYIMGTKEGAILNLLFTGMRGLTRSEQVFRSLRRVEDWGYDVLPPGLNDHSKDKIRWHLQNRFAPYLMRLAAGDGSSMVSRILGAKPFKETSAGETILVGSSTESKKFTNRRQTKQLIT